MTDDQVKEAVAQMIVHCNNAMHNFNANRDSLGRPLNEYPMMSARSVLYDLGYSDDQTESVLLAIAKAGFSYCLDSHIASKNGVGESDGYSFPSDDVCYWGADQLESRLSAIKWNLCR